MTKPVLNRPCPLCSGPMRWCADVPMDVGTPEEMPTHVCHQLVCTTCDYNLDFNLTNDPARDLDLPELLEVIAAKWNGVASTQREEK